MHLIEFLEQRSVPAAGISLALTRRCPLSCAHCATHSTMSSDESPAETFLRFVDTFTVDDHPAVVAISGGEAFLRADLMVRVAERARASGSAIAALSGMYWATASRIPPAIKRAIDSLDHFSASMDIFHEREVPRADVYRALEQLVGEGKDVSIHLVGLDADDPYLAEVTDEVIERFDGRVPMLVNTVNPMFGRAKEWAEQPVFIGGAPIEADPCTLAFWPVLAFDGTIVACGNDDVVDGPAPAHLRLGHATTDSWSTIRERSLNWGVLRGIRSYGPEYLADRAGVGDTCDGYCGTCQKLSDHESTIDQIVELMARPSSKVIEDHALAIQHQAGPVAFIQRYGLGRYADLVTLGAPVSAAS